METVSHPECSRQSSKVEDHALVFLVTKTGLRWAQVRGSWPARQPPPPADVRGGKDALHRSDAEFIESSGISPGKGHELSRKTNRQQTRVSLQLVPGKLHEQSLVSIEERLGGFIADLQLFADFVVEVFQQLAARLRHCVVDLQTQFKLKFVEGDLDFLVLAAALVDVIDAFSKSTPLSIAPNTSSLAPKTPSNNWNFLGQQFIHTLVGSVLGD